MGDYIDTVLLNQRGAHFGGADLGKAIAKLYDETLDGLVYWSQSVWRAASGLVSVESSSSAVFKIILDGSEIGETPFTFPVTAQIEHKISFRSAAAQLERVVQLKDGEPLSISVP